MPRPYAFINDVKSREEFVRAVIEEINSHIEEGKPKYDVEEILKKSFTDEKIEEFNKANDALERDKKRKEYAESLLGNKKLAGRFERIYYQKIDIPEENDPNKDEINRKNREIVDKFTDPSRVHEIVKEEMELAFKADKTLFYPENLDEAIKNYDDHHELMTSCFVLDSTLSNNSCVPSEEFLTEYRYYKESIEDAQNVYNYIEEKASPYSLFIPEDIPEELLFMSIGKLNELADKYTDYGISTDPKDNGNVAFGAHLKDRRDTAKNRKELKEFFTENDKNHDFILKHQIGGRTFKTQFEKIGKDEANKSIVEGFKGANALETGNTLTTNISKDLRTSLNNARKVFNDYMHGTLSDTQLDLTYYDNNNENPRYLHEKLDEVCFLYAIMQNDNSQRCEDGKYFIKNYLSEFKVSDKAIQFYKNIADGIVPTESVIGISKDGYKVFGGAMDASRSRAELQNFKSSSISSLRKKFDKGDIKKDVKRDPTKFMTFAKAINEKYNSRSEFWKRVSPRAWREKWLIDDINKFAAENHLNENALNEFVASDDKTFNAKFKACHQSIKEAIPANEVQGTRENLNVDYFDHIENKNEVTINEADKQKIKEQFIDVDKNEVIEGFEKEQTN